MLCSYFISKLYLKLTGFCFPFFFIMTFIFEIEHWFLFTVLPLATVDLQSTLL